MTKKILYVCISTIFTFSARGQQLQKQDFTFSQVPAGIELKDHGLPVFFYQSQPKSSTGEFVCNNYIHPLYGLDGEVLTEEFPVDHPYHRGIFWAWHQIYVGDKSIGDAWVMKDIVFQVREQKFSVKKNIARIDLLVQWSSPKVHNGEAFLEERTTIEVHAIDNNKRIIDFSIELKPLVDGLSIGGSEEVEKGYGGFCARIKTPADLVFTAENGQVMPITAQVKAGNRMDFSAKFTPARVSGLTIFNHPSNPGPKAVWILRQMESMQNTVFPGSVRYQLPMPGSTRLHYRLLIHRGNAGSINLAGQEAQYNKIDFSR